MIPAWLIKYGGGALGMALILWGIHHHGYTAGVRDERAIWQLQFMAAQQAFHKSEGRRKAIETASAATKADLENRIGQITRESNAALADSGKRNADILRQLAARPRSCPAAEVAGSAPADDGAAESEGRADKAGASLAGITADCRHDADILELWQEWYEREAALRR